MIKSVKITEMSSDMREQFVDQGNKMLTIAHNNLITHLIFTGLMVLTSIWLFINPIVVFKLNLFFYINIAVLCASLHRLKLIYIGYRICKYMLYMMLTGEYVEQFEVKEEDLDFSVEAVEAAASKVATDGK